MKKYGIINIELPLMEPRKKTGRYDPKKQSWHRKMANTVSFESTLTYRTCKKELEQLLKQKITYYRDDKIKVTVRFLKDDGYNCIFKFQNKLELKVHGAYIYGDELLITVKDGRKEYVLFYCPKIMLTQRLEMIEFVESQRNTNGSRSKTSYVEMNTVPKMLIAFIDAISSISAKNLRNKVNP